MPCPRCCDYLGCEGIGEWGSRREGSVVAGPASQRVPINAVRTCNAVQTLQLAEKVVALTRLTGKDGSLVAAGPGISLPPSRGSGSSCALSLRLCCHQGSGSAGIDTRLRRGVYGVEVVDGEGDAIDDNDISAGASRDRDRFQRGLGRRIGWLVTAA